MLAINSNFECFLSLWSFRCSTTAAAADVSLAVVALYILNCKDYEKQHTVNVFFSYLMEVPLTLHIEIVEHGSRYK